MAAFASRQGEGNGQNEPILYAQDFLHMSHKQKDSFGHAY